MRLSNDSSSAGWARWAAVALAAAVTFLALPSAAGAQEPQQPEAPPEQTEPGQPAQPAQDPSFVRGTLNYRDDGERVTASGVDLTVESSDGAFTQTVTTDDRGRFEFELPGEDDYRISIDPRTLPEGVSLLDEDRTELEIHLREGQSRAVTFGLTTGETRGGRNFAERAAQLGVEGIRFGLILAMCSIGLSLIFGTTGLVNFAHGEMVTFGALMAYMFNVTVGWSLLVGAPMAIVAGGLFGAVFNWGVWRPLRNRGTGLVAMLVVSIGVSLLMRFLFHYQVGGENEAYDDFQGQTVVDVGPVNIVPRDFWIMGLSVLLLVAVALFLQLTLAGKAMRAVADDRDLAAASGINVERVISWVWISGGALAATGGIFFALDEQVNWQVGFLLLLLMFAAVTLGGLGTAFGALVGGIAIGMFVQLSALVIDPEFRWAAALGVLIVVLLVRPQGILGQAERVG